jgi:ribosomal protein L15
MGRSQVLYNRTKARIRAGRGGSSGRGETGDRSNQNHSNLNETTPSNDHYDTAPSSSWRKPKRYSVSDDNDDNEEDISFQQSESYTEADAANFKNAEADLLLDMQSAQAYAYAPSATQHGGREKGSGLNLLSSGGDDTHSALNVSAMAASLNLLPLSQRWMIPRHLAAALVVNGEDDEDTQEEREEEDKGFKEEDESVPSVARDTVIPVAPVDSAVVRVVAATPSVQANLPISLACSSESMLGVPESSEQRENNKDDPAHPLRVVNLSAADRRRRNLLQRASAVTSPNDLMSDDNDQEDNQGEYDDNDDDDDVITRRRREMEGSTREGDPCVFCPSVSDTANATAPIEANISTATVIDCTGEEDVDQWLESALGTDTYETEIEEGEGELDEWLDGVIQ